MTSTRDKQYDLLTAALIGVVLGVGSTMLFGERKRVVPIGRAAWKAGRAGASMAGRGIGALGDQIDRIPMDDIADSVREHADAAREAIGEIVASEVKDLRRAMRKQRQKLGI